MEHPEIKNGVSLTVDEVRKVLHEIDEAKSKIEVSLLPVSIINSVIMNLNTAGAILANK